MNESIIVVTVDEAINRLIQHKQIYGDHIYVCIVDLANGIQRKERKSIEEGCNIITKSGTLLFNEDDYVPHLMAFNLHVDDVFCRDGKIHDFLLSNKVSEKENKQVFDSG